MEPNSDSLAVVGAGDAPFHCFITRNKKNSTFYLYLGLIGTKTFMEKGKFLLAARKFRHGAHAVYIISDNADDFSEGSSAYVGKLSSNIFGNHHKIYTSQPPFDGAKPSNSLRFASKKISPQVSAGNFEIGHVSFKRSNPEAPKKMICTLQCPTSKQQEQPPQNTVFKNKTPRWHKALKFWCLDFQGRVTIKSVKNFQLLAPGPKGEDETILLQFGRVGDDTFTMYYREPLSAFVAFAISLTQFGKKHLF